MMTMIVASIWIPGLLASVAACLTIFAQLKAAAQPAPRKRVAVSTLALNPAQARLVAPVRVNTRLRVEFTNQTERALDAYLSTLSMGGR
jgi:hypothetical protein